MTTTRDNADLQTVIDALRTSDPKWLHFINYHIKRQLKNELLRSKIDGGIYPEEIDKLLDHPIPAVREAMKAMMSAFEAGTLSYNSGSARNIKIIVAGPYGAGSIDFVRTAAIHASYTDRDMKVPTSYGHLALAEEVWVAGMGDNSKYLAQEA